MNRPAHEDFGSNRDVRASLCRLCTAFCPILVTVEDGRATKVAGNPRAPLYGGYTCPKGRALPAQHYGPARLLRSQRRQADGSFGAIGAEAAMDEIAERLRAIVAEHGPRSVAIYTGMGSVPYVASYGIAAGWLRALGSPMFFTAGSIDKPGILIALAMHGMWQAGQPRMAAADAWLMVGINPVISKSPGFPGQNPGQMLKEMVGRGTKVVVIDPRRTETAKRAHIHLQPRPGEDPTLLAGLIHIILAEGLYDHAFVAAETQGIEALREAVAPFDPAYVTQRADVPVEDLLTAARTFGAARRAGVSCGTGPSFSTHSTLTEYLALCLTSLCGGWLREGEPVSKPNVLLPAFQAKAQPWPPFQGWGFEPRLRVRGLGACASGLSAAALADEILLPGEGQVRALIVVGGNPMMAWPDQTKTFEALKSLDLLVTLDTEMTATAELSHYVIAPKLTLETPATTYMPESVKYYGTTRGFEQPFAAYTPALVDPPAEADVIEDWELFWGLARRLGFKIRVNQMFGNGPQAEHPPAAFDLDPAGPKPSTDEIIARSHACSRIPLDVIKQNPDGALFDIHETVAARDPGNAARLELAAPLMIDELAQVRATPPLDDPDFPYRLITRRMNRVLNSFGRRIPELAGDGRNPAFMHPDDMAALGLGEDEPVVIRSPYGVIQSHVKAEASLRRGVVSMSHGFGASPGEDDPDHLGGNTGRLLSNEVEFDPITGLPRMSAVPVRIVSASAHLEHIRAAATA